VRTIALILCKGKGVHNKFITEWKEDKERKRNTVTVYKTHNIDLLSNMKATFPDEEPWVFTTRTKEDDNFAQKSKKLHLDVKFNQQYEQVSNTGPFTSIRHMQPIFNLTDGQVLQITSFFRYWDILRVCCGPQQSKVHIQQLTGDKTSRDPMAADYPACEMYDISQVEHLALAVEQSIGVRGLLELPKVGYCACFEGMKSKHPEPSSSDIVKKCGEWH
jgi:hypothetical protein